MHRIVRVATINLLNDLSRWSERRPWLVRELAALDLDLIGVQEVTTPLAHSTAHELADDLGGGYEVFVCPKTGWGRSREGIAILSRLPVESHVTLDLKSQQRVAQSIRVRIGARSVVFANGHFHWHPGAHAARVRQVERVIEWLGTLDPNAARILVGDFNGTPGSPAIARMRVAYRSAHEVGHGCEPDFTYPSPLVNRWSLRSAVTSGLLRIFSNNPGGSWRGTLDYIFISPVIRVASCGVILDRPSPTNPSLYASDHLGLAAELDVSLDAAE
jgi:endonuclease/exonuclease/phosphatase family metal-dependent hydrolase